MQEFEARKIGEMKPFLNEFCRSVKEFGIMFINIWKVVSNFTSIMWSKLQWLIINYPRAFAAGQFAVLVLSCGYCFVTNRFQDNNYSRQLYLNNQQKETEKGISYAKGYEQCMRDNGQEVEELQLKIKSMQQAEAERVKAIAERQKMKAAITKAKEPTPKVEE